MRRKLRRVLAALICLSLFSGTVAYAQQSPEEANASLMGAAKTLTESEVEADFREKGAPFLEEDTSNFFWVTLPDGCDVSEYTFTLKGPGGDTALSPAKTGQAKNNTRQKWLQYKPTAPGDYKIEISKDGTVVTKTVTLYKVTFQAGTGKFTDQNTSYTGYGTKDSAWRQYNIPSSPAKEGEENFHGFLGWSKEENADSYEKVIDSLAGIGELPGNHEVTLHAAYGSQKVTKLDFKKGEQIVTEKMENLGNVTADEEAPTKHTYTLENTGNQSVNHIDISASGTFHIEFTKPESPFAQGNSVQFTISAKPGTPKGHYQSTIWAFGYDDSNSIKFRAYMMAEMDVTATGTVKVTPPAKTKKFGETLTAAEVMREASFSPSSYTWEKLGASLHSDGFAASAPVNTYSYSVTGGREYDIQIAGENKVTVEKADPSEKFVNAAEVRVGAKLSDATLSYEFENPYTHEDVPGTLTWTESGDTKLSQAGTAPHNWTFRPTDQHNYNDVSGSCNVTVVEKDPTTLSVVGETTFTYDKTAHPITFHASSGAEVKVQYEVGNSWTDTVPTKAGSYKVKGTAEETSTHAGATAEATLTILPVTLTVTVNANSKTYDGTLTCTGVTAHLQGVLDGDHVSVSATGAFENKNAGIQVVNVELGALTGTDAANYQLSASTAHTTATILTKPITIKANTVSKEYGATRLFTAADFTATGLVQGESLADQPVTYSSEGSEASAKTGTYIIYAQTNGGNYTTGNTAGASGTKAATGNLTVTKATPVKSDAGVTAGLGRKGGTLKTVSLNGTFVNPHDSSMTCHGILSWQAPDTKLPDNQETYQAGWIFTPSDDNYTGTVKGEIAISLTDKQVIGAEVSEKTVTYNGSAQSIDAPSLGADADKATVIVEYRLRKELSLPSDTSHDEFVTEPPKEAGIYDVHVHIKMHPEYQEEYIDNLIQTTLTIAPADPDLTGVTAPAADYNATLSDIKLSGAKGVDKQPLNGTYVWNEPGSQITREGEFSYTFTPESSNYRTATSTVHLTLKKDTRVISGVVYNYPDGYQDLAIINTGNLKAGEEITLFADSTCLNAISAPAIVTKAGSTVHVSIDNNALQENKGTIYAKITNNPTTSSNALPYKAQMGMILPEEIAVYKDKTASVAITLPEGYEESDIKEVAFQAEGSVFTAESSKKLTLTVTGKQEGTALLEVTLTYTVPTEDTVKVTKSVPVTVEIDPNDIPTESGKVEFTVPADPSAPDVSVDQETQKKLLDELISETEKQHGAAVELIVKETSPTEADQKLVNAILAQQKAGYTAETYLDISLLKKVGQDAASKVTSLKSAIALTVTIPEELRLAGREFCVIRVHDNKAEILPDTDKNPDTITFMTDKFSAYAIGHSIPHTEHTYDGYVFDDLGHHQVCSVCGEETKVENHRMQQKSDAQGHWEVCTVCGYTTTKQPHSFVDGKCSVCGYKEADAKPMPDPGNGGNNSGNQGGNSSNQGGSSSNQGGNSSNQSTTPGGNSSNPGTQQQSVCALVETTPGADTIVKVGDTLTYRVYYANDSDVPVNVSIRVPLDPGIDYLKGANAYNAEKRELTWTISEVKAKASGYVEFQAQVNKFAVERIETAAFVKFGEKEEIRTETLVNPLIAPHQEVNQPKDGEAAEIETVVVYQITYVNTTSETAAVIVRDFIDPGVKFVEASEGGIFNGEIVIFRIEDVPAGGTGTVTVKVEVLDNGTDKIVNTVYQRIGDNEVQLNTTEVLVKEPGGDAQNGEPPKNEKPTEKPEEKPEEKPSSGNQTTKPQHVTQGTDVQTGETIDIIIWIAVAVVAALSLIAVLVMRKKKRQ